MTAFATPDEWTGPSEDPADEQFGDVVEQVSPDDVDTHDAVLVGEPYDGAVIGNRGARLGPSAIRKALAATKTHHFATGPVKNLGDLGDVVIDDADSVGDVQAAIARETAFLHSAPVFPVFIGGDNSVTVPNVSPLLDAGSVGVVNLDAHLDCREVRDEPTSGTPYRQLLESGLDAVAVIGARHFETSGTYQDYLTDNGGTIVTAPAAGRDPKSAAASALDALGDVEYVYVSLDVDVLDAATAPGVSAPTPGGLSSREVFTMLSHLATDERVAGFEVVECAPPLDRNSATVRIAARAIAHVLAHRGGNR
ncbi:MAG: formimidoylglutamase [archaeon]